MSQEQIWDEIARDWKKYREEPLEEVIEFIQEHDTKGAKILDLGCGTGRNFCETEGKIYGVDFSENMLKIAEQYARQGKLNFELKKGNLDKIPYEDEFFECVVYSRALHCVESKDKRNEALRELFRVMKKGTECLIQVWSKNSSRVKNKTKDVFVPWTVNKKKLNRYYYIYDADELKRDLEKVGFTVEKIWENENVNVVVKK